MSRKLKYMALLMFMILGIATSAWAADDVKVGDDAPDFTLLDREGNKVSLSDFKGKAVVLTFTRAHWCPDCMNQLAQFAKAADQFKEAKAEVLVIFRENEDGAEGLKKADEIAKGNFHLLDDPEAKATPGYSSGEFSTYIIDGDGKVRADLTGVLKIRPATEAVLKELSKL